jgi:RNA polymerase sigma factor, sigma-70 family
VGADELSSMMEVASDAASLSQPVDEDGDMVLGDVLEQTTVPSAEDTIASKFLKEDVEQALERLDENERKVLRLRFGLDNDTPHTLKEIGDMMNLSRERIRQIEAKALDKLRHNRRARSLVSYLN